MIKLETIIGEECITFCIDNFDKKEASKRIKEYIINTCENYIEYAIKVKEIEDKTKRDLEELDKLRSNL